MKPAPASAVIDAEPWGIKLGIATYSLRMFDRATAIEMLKKFQVKYVSIKDVHLKIGAPPEETKAGRAEFDAAGLVVTSGGNVDMTKGTTVEELRKQFEYAKAAGLPMMVCAPTHENIKAVETLVKEYNIRIAIHNHGPEDKHFPTPQSVLEVVRKLDKRCGLCMDIGHSARTGVDVVKTIAEPATACSTCMSRISSDMKVKESQCDIGDGAMPFPAIFKQLKKMGYTGCINMEYEVPVKDPTMGMHAFVELRARRPGGLAARIDRVWRTSRSAPRVSSRSW